MYVQIDNLLISFRCNDRNVWNVFPFHRPIDNKFAVTFYNNIIIVLQILSSILINPVALDVPSLFFGRTHFTVYWSRHTHNHFSVEEEILWQFRFIKTKEDFVCNCLEKKREIVLCWLCKNLVVVYKEINQCFWIITKFFSLTVELCGTTQHEYCIFVYNRWNR